MKKLLTADLTVVTCYQRPRVLFESGHVDQMTQINRIIDKSVPPAGPVVRAGSCNLVSELRREGVHAQSSLSNISIMLVKHTVWKQMNPGVREKLSIIK